MFKNVVLEKGISPSVYPDSRILSEKGRDIFSHQNRWQLLSLSLVEFFQLRLEAIPDTRREISVRLVLYD